MATEPSPRAWRAACPNCGAPVDFRSAAAPLAVCSFCRSTLLRDGESLRRIGQVGELFDDHTPLQLGASGRYQGASFTLVGRLQWRAAEGTWNEWHAVFDTARSGWLSEDNGQYVFGFDSPPDAPLPAAKDLRPGQGLTLGGRAWTVGAVTPADIVSAEGELPAAPAFGQAHTVVELRSAQGEVASWAVPTAGTAAVPLSVGRAVRLADLGLTGLKDDSVRALKGRAFNCPSCGAGLTPRLDTTQSLVCGECKSVVDVSQGLGAELKHFGQENPVSGGATPLIPLGSSGRLALGGPQTLGWQVVGYLERAEVPDDPQDDWEFWREYLLWNRIEGFAFLVDAEDGWSWVRPISGAPKVSGSDRVSWDGVEYRKKYSYTAQTTWVLGEFYWPVSKDQRSFNTDYAGTGTHADRTINREQAGNEITWSAGAGLDADVVRKAFELPQERAAVFKRDVGASSGPSFSLATFFVLLFIVVVIFAMARCSRDDCDNVRATYGSASAEYQQCLRSGGSRGGSGGSFGGFSSGGSHK